MAESRVCRGNSIPQECDSNDPTLIWGDDIGETLLTTDDAIQERGRVAIDGTFTNRKRVAMNLHGMDYMEKNSMIEIVDGVNRNKGILRGLTLSIVRNNNDINITKTIEVERNM